MPPRHVLGGPLWVAAALAFHGASYDTALGYKESGSAVVITLVAALVTAVAGLLLASARPGRRRR